MSYQAFINNGKEAEAVVKGNVDLQLSMDLLSRRRLVGVIIESVVDSLVA